jgi:hypothetical protein
VLLKKRTAAADRLPVLTLSIRLPEATADASPPQAFQFMLQFCHENGLIPRRNPAFLTKVQTTKAEV